MRGFSLVNFRKYHLRLGLILAFPLGLVASTGIILSWSEVIRDRQWPFSLSSIELSPPPSQPIPLSQFLESTRKTFPDIQIQTVFPSHSADHSVRVETENKRYFLDPHTAEVLTSLSKEDGLSFLLKVHRGTWAGWNGRLVMSIVGVLLTALWILGFLLRRVRVSKIKRPQTLPKASPVYWHRKLGFIIGAGLGLMGLSGALLNFNKDLLTWLDPLPEAQVSLKSDPRLSIDSMTALALKAHPNAELRSIHFPKKNENLTLFYFLDNSRVYIQSDLQQIQKIMTPQANWFHWLYPVHSGKIYGPLKPGVLSILGVSLFVLLASGVMIQRKR